MNPNFGNLLAAAPDQYKVLWWIVLFPLIGAAINGLFGRKIGRDGVYIVGVATVAASFLLSLFAFAALVKAGAAHHAEGAAEGAAHAAPQLSYAAWDWFRAPTLRLPTGEMGAAQLRVRYVLDNLSGVMLLVVTGVGTLIHLYSTGYMSHDKGYAKFFAFLNLFMFSMLNLILGDSMVLLFVGWEGVGLCSYLLIGFWYTNSQYASAGRKAFIVNRIGDVGVILGMTILAWKLGAYEFSAMREAAQQTVGGDPNPTMYELTRATELGDFLGNFLGRGNPAVVGFFQKVLPNFTWGGLACFLLFVGCTGKSAQLPLYVWLPDAMAGPTPVSALIHAATMVTAGVYLLCRMAFLFGQFPAVMALIALIGGLTALFAATIAVAQNELKKVLAYSTVSQLGFMFLGCGVGAFDAGLFHVYTHAMFKACLFLGAGAVMHACRDKQDLRELGGLKRFLPVTYATFAVATLAIVGTPGLSGFFSKDEILFRALASHNPAVPWAGKVAFALGLLAATLTAFYMARLLFLTFWGEFKGWSLTPGSLRPPPATDEDAAGDPDHAHAEHEPANAHAAHDGHDHDDGHGDDHGHGDHGHSGNPWDPPVENPWPMTVPLIVLAALSAVAGYVGLPALFSAAHGGENGILPKFLHPVLGARPGESARAWEHIDHAAAHGTEVLAMALGVGAFVVGVGAAYWVYVMQGGEPARRLASAAPPLYRLVYDKWRVDELYNLVIVRPLRFVSDIAARFVDRFVIDGLVTLAGVVVKFASFVTRKLQTGVVQTYGAVIAVGLLAMLGWATLRPAATFSYRLDGDQVVVEGHGGLGYRYRWDLEGDGTFGPATTAARQAVRCTPTETEDGRRVCRIGLQATNAFGYSTRVVRTIEMPNQNAQGQAQ